MSLTRNLLLIACIGWERYINKVIKNAKSKMELSEIIEAKKNGYLRLLKSETLEYAQKVVDLEVDRVLKQIGVDGETPELVDYYELLYSIADSIFGALIWRNLTK